MTLRVRRSNEATQTPGTSVAADLPQTRDGENLRRKAFWGAAASIQLMIHLPRARLASNDQLCCDPR
jgi:hypothetical protein